jgi:glyoxylase-like metal-dependent hydrolase (beta-lactamase superfamily II)
MHDQPSSCGGCDPDVMTLIDVPSHEIVGVRAANPGPFTLSGTNSWIVDREPAWLVDPGPALDDHVATLVEVLKRRGGLAGIALTHEHADHAQATGAVRERFPDASVAAAGGAVDVVLRDGSEFGPLEAVATPGHAPDHLAFLYGTVALTGDAVLGEGSVFISPDPGALAGYLDGLSHLRRRDLAVLCPGHGPVVDDPASKLDEYIDHRLERERRLLAALAAGKRGMDELLDDVWDDAPDALRPAAAITLAAHLDKLADEGKLPAGVDRKALAVPSWWTPG